MGHEHTHTGWSVPSDILSNLSDNMFHNIFHFPVSFAEREGAVLGKSHYCKFDKGCHGISMSMSYSRSVGVYQMCVSVHDCVSLEK